MTERQPGEASGHRSRIKVRVLGPRDGEILGALTAVRDRFMIDARTLLGG